MPRRLPPPLPWQEGGRPPGKPAPWEETSHYPGFSAGTGFQADPTEGEPAELHWIPVSSSNVDAISWNQGSDFPLWVRFKDSGHGSAVYAYDVPESVYQDMFGASSHGRFVRYVLGQYPYRRVY